MDTDEAYTYDNDLDDDGSLEVGDMEFTNAGEANEGGEDLAYADGQAPAACVPRLRAGTSSFAGQCAQVCP